MAKPQLVYDANCPICTNYVRLLKKKVTPDKLEYVPSTASLDEFQYINADGVTFEGAPAIDELTKDFSEVTQFFWLLPQKYRTTALKAVYAASGVVRNVLGRVKKGGCGCGKKK